MFELITSFFTQNAKSRYLSTVLQELDSKTNLHYPVMVFTVPDLYDPEWVVDEFQKHLSKRQLSPWVYRASDHRQHIFVDFTDNFSTIDSHIQDSLKHMIRREISGASCLAGSYKTVSPINGNEYAAALRKTFLEHGKKTDWEVVDNHVILMSYSQI